MKYIILKVKLTIASILVLTIGYGCDDFLEVESLTKVSPKILLNDDGFKTLLSQMYNGLPIEDFKYVPAGSGTTPGGFNRGWYDDVNSCLNFASGFTDESSNSHGGSPMAMGGYNMWSSESTNGNFNAWERNRQVSIFQKYLLQAKNEGSISDDVYNRLWSETYFARAYIYFALAKRFGGVPIIDKYQDDDYIANGEEALFVPRSTESDTWKFILDCCDKATQYLPIPEDFEASDGNPIWRANKWTAYALKSRAALYAASIAKFGNRVSFPNGAAVNQKIVGIDPTEAVFFYGECISASKAIIEGGHYSLYKPNPENPDEAVKNYQNLFMNPASASEEVIFGKTYLDGSVYTRQGHQFDHLCSPHQVSLGWNSWSGRLCPTLDIVDLYEDYTDDGTGKSALIVTRSDGKEHIHLSTNTPSTTDIMQIPFVKYDDPLDAFKNKDARLHASIILPGSLYKGTTIVMQGGLIGKDGNISLYGGNAEVGHDGKMYYVLGGETSNQYSAFDGPMTVTDYANWSCTGFSIRKFLGEDKSFPPVASSATTPWIDFRLAEIYLNYAEAVVESGLDDITRATEYINALRKRAGHTDKIPLTVDNVQKERRIEMAFEHNRVWDLYRRREYHTLFNNYRKKSLVQCIDLRGTEPKYVFLRIENYHSIRAGGHTFQINDYYQEIPGVNVSGLPNNPGRD